MCFLSPLSRRSGLQSCERADPTTNSQMGTLMHSHTGKTTLLTFKIPSLTDKLGPAASFRRVLIPQTARTSARVHVSTHIRQALPQVSADRVLVAEASEVSDDADFKRLRSHKVPQHVQDARSLENQEGLLRIRVVIMDSNTLALNGLSQATGSDLVVRDIIKDLLDLHGILHVSGDGMGGGEGVHLHGLEAFPQEEVILGHSFKSSN